jgi:prophage tail gpP-like protein
LVKGIESTGENRGTDEHYSDDARANRARAENPYAKNNNTQEHVAPQPGDVKDFKMHADHMADLNTAEALTVNITVRGWLKSDGSLWMNHVGESVSVYSPMLFPQKSAQLWIQTVTHRQSDGAGTTTTISLTLNRLLKGGGGIEADGPGTSDDAKEQPPDS